MIRRAGLLHDLGKLMVLDAILLKPGPLTPEELAVMRRHPVVAGRILRRLRHFEREAEAVEHHLERYDGTGHPDAQRGEAIPLAARIVAVADAFDAMTSPRPYRRPHALEAALDEVGRGAGGQFDPRLVEAFVGLPAARLHEISRYYRYRPAMHEADPGADQPSYLGVARGYRDTMEALRSAVAGGLGWVKLIEDRRGERPTGPARHLNNSRPPRVGASSAQLVTRRASATTGPLSGSSGLPKPGRPLVAARPGNPPPRLEVGRDFAASRLARTPAGGYAAQRLEYHEPVDWPMRLRAGKGE